MSAKEEVVNQLRSRAYSIGLGALNALFPNDCEYYMLGLELVNSEGKTVDYLTFPVMPQQIKESKPEKTSIVETAGGVVSIVSPTFKPRDISISGNFGRGVSFNSGGKVFHALKYSTTKGVYHKEDMNQVGKNIVKMKSIPLNPFIKTGYGFIKVLESMIDKASGIDEFGKPLILHFYNPAFGNNYIVDPTSSDFHQDKQGSNMIWNYTLNLKATAPLFLSVGEKESRISSLKAAGFSAIDKEIKKVVSKISVPKI